MARCRGSFRNAPSSRSPAQRVTRTMNSIDKSYAFDMAGNPCKRRAGHAEDADDADDADDAEDAEDDAAPEQKPPKTILLTSAVPSNDATAPNKPEQSKTPEIPENDVAHAKSDREDAPVNEPPSEHSIYTRDRNLLLNAREFLNADGSSAARLAESANATPYGRRRERRGGYHHSIRKEPSDEFLTGASWKDLGPARFEANELRRADMYKREVERMEDVHDFALLGSVEQKKKLLSHWEDSRWISAPKQKNYLETPQTEATAKTAQNPTMAIREGMARSLSPVFPIVYPARSIHEADPLDLDGSGPWPVDLPEPRVDSSYYRHVPIPSPKLPANLLQPRRRSPTPHPHEREGQSPQTPRERYLACCRQVQKQKEEQQMSLGAMSKFVDFDAER